MNSKKTDTLNKIVYDFLLNFEDDHLEARQQLCADLLSEKITIPDTKENRETLMQHILQVFNAENPPPETIKNIDLVSNVARSLGYCTNKKLSR